MYTTASYPQSHTPEEAITSQAKPTRNHAAATGPTSSTRAIAGGKHGASAYGGYPTLKRHKNVLAGNAGERNKTGAKRLGLSPWSTPKPKEDPMEPRRNHQRPHSYRTGEQLTKDLARFRAKVKPDEETGCWLWTAAKHEFGYGSFWTGKYGIGAHVWAYLYFVGELPDGHLIRHKCDVASCVNPDHLETGTMKDNTTDAFNRGRRTEGYRPSLNYAKAEEIRNKFYGGTPSKDLQHEYGISRAVMRSIIERTAWTDDRKPRYKNRGENY